MSKSRQARTGRTGVPPKRWQRLAAEMPRVAAAYGALREACDATGPLPRDLVALVKLAVSIGARDWRTTHIHTKKALLGGVAPDVLRQAAFIALPSIGLPAALDALDWIDESIAEQAIQSGASDTRQDSDGRAPRSTRSSRRRVPRVGFRAPASA